MKKTFCRKLIFVVFAAVFACFFCAAPAQVVFANQPAQINNFVDISGLSQKKAIEKAKQHLEGLVKNLEVNISYEGKVFKLRAASLPTKNTEQLVIDAREQEKPTNFFDKINIFKNRSRKILIYNMDFFNGIDNFIEATAKKVECEVKEPEVKFTPNKKVMFAADNGVVGVKVDRNTFKQRLKQAFMLDDQAPEIALPVVLTKPTSTASKAVSEIVKRSTFSTNYTGSVGGRRHNVLLSLSAFNGMVVKPGEVVSFNQQMRKLPTSSFRSAKIIVNGEFVDGIGGGMCQASTTIYNAVLLAGLDVLKSYSHSLPVGYVKFGFDAMVNPGSADLVFKNTTNKNIYIKTYGNDDDCFVEIYGQAMPKGLVLKRKSVNVGTLKHKGDKIIPDVKGVYSNKILFKGEFHRVKYPQEGYEARSYLQYWVDGELVEEKYLRYSRYNAQQGIVYEGVEDLPEGLEDNLKTPGYKLQQQQDEAQELSAQQITEKVKKTSHFNP